MTSLDELPLPVVELCRAFLSGLQQILGDNMVGVYLYGAMTFADSRDTIADIDYHVILRHPLDDATRQAIHQFRRSLGTHFPPLGDELDGYFVTLDDAKRTACATTQMHPLWRLPVDQAWALHCAHIRAGQVISLCGPDPLTIYPEPSWPELEAALWNELRYVEEHQEDAPAYCILNATRILYSMRTHDVVISKRGAALWGLANLPREWHDPIRLAMRAYEGSISETDRMTLEHVVKPWVSSITSVIRNEPAIP